MSSFDQRGQHVEVQYNWANRAAPHVVAHAEAHFTEHWPTRIVGPPRPVGQKMWDGSVDIRLENVGDDAALYVQASFKLGDTAYRAPSPTIITALRPGPPTDLIRFVPPPEVKASPWGDEYQDGEILVNYRDTNQREHRMVQRVRVYPGPGRVELLDPADVTVAGDDHDGAGGR